jgi:N-acetylneuraminic acid mutarotase
MVLYDNGAVGYSDYSAVWTGTEFIIWGGEAQKINTSNSILNSGWSYNLSKDQWKSISNIGAPSPRRFHSAVWTGSEMIIWGGMGDAYPSFNDGGIYNPVSDAWRPMSTLSAPQGRIYPSLVWTGTEIVVASSKNGGIYNPKTDTWRSMSTATGVNLYLSGGGSKAYWTGTDVLVDGAKYNLATDTWKNTNLGGNIYSVLVATDNQLLTMSYKYIYATDQLIPISGVNAPSKRINPFAVWTGTEIWVIGGSNTGKFDPNNPPPPILDGRRYNPSTDTWNTIPSLPFSISSGDGVPYGFGGGLGLWTGTEIILFRQSVGLRLKL